MATVATAPAQNVRNVKEEMRGHRERLKQAVHPGMTQREAGMTTEERKRLVMGVCSDLSAATERGERWANWAMIILAVVLFAAMGVGMVQDRWAERAPVQTVEAGR